MQKTIISCKSRSVTKERMKAFLMSNEFVHDEFLIKIKNGKQNCSSIENGLHVFSCDILMEKLYKTRNRSVMEFKIKHDSVRKRAYEHGIRKEYILSNIHEFVKLTKIFIIMQKMKYNTYIKGTDYSAFVILKLNENGIGTVSEFAGRELESVITNDVLHELKYT